MAQAAREPGPGEIFCPSCGEIIEKHTKICNECGVRNTARSTPERSASKEPAIGRDGYIIIGVISALVSLVLLPIILGPISLFSGFQVYRHWDETWGIGIMILGGACTILGMMVGMAAVAA